MKTTKYGWLIGIAFFLLVGTFGATSMAMAVNANGTMSGCPFAGTGAVCQMDPLQHAFTLQTMLTAVPSIGLFAFFVLLLLSISLVLLAPLFWAVSPILFKSFVRPPPALYRALSRHTLQEAFASGVLNTKAF
jgi:hypothetical protein